MSDRDGNQHNNTSYRQSTGPNTAPHRREGRRGLLGWLLGAALLIGLLVLVVRSCDTADNRMSTTSDGGTATTAGRVNDAGDPMVPAIAYRSADFDSYLAGSEPVGRSFTLDRVTFASGSSELDNAARAEVAELAGVLQRYPRAQIQLTGFADPQGEAAANQTLSRQRAEAVRAALTEAGAPAGSVTLTAEGETGNAATRANRKVEVRVTSR